MKRALSFLLFSLLFGFHTMGQVRLAPLFSDNMVLQRDVKIPVWGFAKAHEKIAVSFHEQLKKVAADAAGKWIVYLDKESAGGPFELTVKGSTTLQISNVLVGEVWLCSGQSNMEWTVGQSANAVGEVANSNNPMIRHIKIAHDINSVPSESIQSASWQVCSPKTVGDFTGVGYFYAKQLYEKLGVPVGIINASWGGTNIETWISREGFEGSDAFKEMISHYPKIDLETLKNLKLTNGIHAIEALQKYKFSTDDIPFYKDAAYNDQRWLTLQQPGIWEEQILGNFDGVVWLRKHFVLNKAQLNGPVTLQIPAIDDSDYTFVNGIKVGETIGWDIKRTYTIPAALLKEGDNVIAIRVTDTGGGGGIYGDSSSLRLIVGTKTLPLSGSWKFQVENIQSTINENAFPSLCYNAMIHPLVPFAFKGVLWYQGESNAPRAFEYRKTFPLLIADWRKQWHNDFPFYYVQLATYSTTGDSTSGCPWAELREAQTQTLSIAQTGMVVTTDIGNPRDIHPINKQTVGERLSAIAMSQLYGKASVCGGPMYQSVQFQENQAVLTFSDTGSGLITLPYSSELKGFEIAGADQQFHAATAVLKNNSIVVSSTEVLDPKAVRYAWKGDASEANLFNREGFPASPFRTDNWKSVTKDNHYEIIMLEK